MDWENSPFEEEPMVAEEKTISAVSAASSTFSSASSTLYANESVIEKGNLHLQFKGRFILTSVKSGLMLIDQHRAHIRVLFDRYMVQIKQKQGVSQGVLFPEILQLPASEAAVLQGIMDDLSAVGFDLSDLGGGSYAINGIPSGIEGLNPVELVRNMLHTAMEKGNDVKEEIQNILALTLARAAAIGKSCRQSFCLSFTKLHSGWQNSLDNNQGRGHREIIQIKQIKSSFLKTF